MRKLIKGNVIRLFQNKLFLGGCGIAMFFTFLWCAEFIEILPVLSGEPMERMILCSGAMLFFFSFFVPIYVGVEYSDGIIRNKIITGYNQKTILLSDMITMFIGVIFMTACWLIGGGASGGFESSKIGIFALISMIYTCAHTAMLTTISFRIQKPVVAISISMVGFFILFQSMLFGNFFVNRLGLQAEVRDFGLIIYHLNIIGQWFSHTYYSFGEISIAPVIQILISVAIILFAWMIGVMDLEKRDLN